MTITFRGLTQKKADELVRDFKVVNIRSFYNCTVYNIEIELGKRRVAVCDKEGIMIVDMDNVGFMVNIEKGECLSTIINY